MATMKELDARVRQLESSQAHQQLARDIQEQARDLRDLRRDTEASMKQVRSEVSGEFEHAEGKRLEMEAHILEQVEMNRAAMEVRIETNRAAMEQRILAAFQQLVTLLPQQKGDA